MKKQVLILLVFVSGQISAQYLSTPQEITVEVLEHISKSKNESRDLDSLRNLFIPSATISILNHDEDHDAVESISLDDFIGLFEDPYYEVYHEWETGLVVDEFNGIAQAFQSWEGKDSEGTEGSGLTSYQLVYKENRWWIANILFTGAEGIEIPSKYLNN